MTEFAQVDVSLETDSRFPRDRSADYIARSLGMALTAILMALTVLAQDEDKIVKVETELAVFEVTVTDKAGKPVRNLSAADLRVFEDGIERAVEFFQPIKNTGDRRPLSIVFALDVSGSMTADELERLKGAMQEFISRLADYDSYFSVIAFAMNVKTIQQFTNRPDKLRQAFERLDRDRDGLSTHAYDAVDTAIRLFRKNSPKVVRGKFPKRAIVLISDGFPVGDVVTPETVIERANDAEASVYAVILPSYSNVLGNKRPVLTPLEVSGLIEKTGGKSFYSNAKNHDELFGDLAREITGSYAVAYYPNNDRGAEDRSRIVRIESTKGYTVKQNRSVYKKNR